MRRNYHSKLWGEIITENYPEYHCLHAAKEGGREGYRERVREIEGNTIWRGKNQRSSNRGRFGLTVKLDELLWPSMTFEVILI